MLKTDKASKTHFDYFGDNFGGGDKNSADDLDTGDLSFKDAAQNPVINNPEASLPQNPARRLD